MVIPFRHPPQPQPTDRLTCRACRLHRSAFWRLIRHLPDARPGDRPELCPRCRAGAIVTTPAPVTPAAGR